MRILLLSNSYPSVHSPSGAAYITARVRAARASGAQVMAVALVPAHTPEIALARRLTGLFDNAQLALDSGRDGREFVSATVPWTGWDVACGRLGRTPAAGIARAVRTVRRLPAVREAGFDIVHAHGMYTLPAGEVARRVAEHLAVPYVVSMHGSDVTSVMPRVAPAACATLRSAAATIYVSEALRRQAVACGAATQAAHVIPNGVDLDVFTPRRGEPSGAPRLLFVGNLLPVKGADRLPQILTAVRARHPGAVLDVVGSGPLADRLSGIDGVTLHGRLPPEQVAAAMRRATVLLVPSRAEGWGCVVTESYACGTPVVATRVGGLPEAVVDPAHLVDVPPAQESIGELIADVVDRVVAHPPSAQQLAAHVAQSSWARIVARELAVLQDALR